MAAADERGVAGARSRWEIAWNVPATTAVGRERARAGSASSRAARFVNVMHSTEPAGVELPREPCRAAGQGEGLAGAGSGERPGPGSGGAAITLACASVGTGCGSGDGLEVASIEPPSSPVRAQIQGAWVVSPRASRPILGGVRVVAVVAGIIAAVAWAFFAFVYAAWADIEGLGDSSEIVAGLAVAAIGIACLVAALRRVARGEGTSATVILALAAVAFVAWLAVAVAST